MLAPDIKTLAVAMLIITTFVAISGCEDAYQILETYVPTATPGPESTVRIGDVAPRSTVKDVTITGQGNTITFRGRGPYNVQAHNDYFTLNKGPAELYINLEGGGFGCTISMDYTNPYSGGPEFMTLHQFTSAERVYTLTKQINVPYSCKYCLMVNWGGDWEVRITQ